MKLTQAPHFAPEEFEALLYLRSHGELVAGTVGSSDSRSTRLLLHAVGHSTEACSVVGVRHSGRSVALAFFQS